MLTDPLSQQIGAGGAVGVLMVAVVMKFLPAFMMALRVNRNGNGSLAMTPEAFELMMVRVLNNSNQIVINKLQEINENIDGTRHKLQNDVAGQVLLVSSQIRGVEKTVREEGKNTTDAVIRAIPRPRS